MASVPAPHVRAATGDRADRPPRYVLASRRSTCVRRQHTRSPVLECSNRHRIQLMSSHSRPAADRIISALRTIFGQRLRSVVAYGPHVESGNGHNSAEPFTCLALVASITVGDLEAAAARAHDWKR